MTSSLLDDPFAALEQVAARQAEAEKATKALAGARVRLILGRDAKSAFFATLALRLKPEVDWEIPTMATDGKSLAFNPEFVNGLGSPDELVAVLVHEVMHLAMAHHCRQGDRDLSRWNEATDLSVNPLLLRAGFVLPPGRLMPGEGKYADLPPDKSAEEYYGLLPAPPQGQPNGNGDPGGCGSVRKPGQGSPAEAEDQKAEWQGAVAAAEQASKGRGELPAGLARVVGNVVHPPADWRSVLQEFVSATARNDYSWSRPNRRFVHQGLYLPGLLSEELGEVILAIDTSGSIGEAELNLFGNEVEAILGSFDCSATVLYCDSDIQRVQEWSSSDGPLKLEAIGGGGTSHVPVFEWIEGSGRSPACVICLTDLETDFPSRAPDMPVLWAVVGGNRSSPPFGRVVHVESPF